MATLDAPPARLTAGDSWAWRWAHPSYPASAGWVSAWRVVGPGVALSVSAAASGDGFLATATAAATGALVVGERGLDCTLSGWVTLGLNRFQAYQAPLFLSPDPATVTGDLRGHATRTLAAIDALLEGRATKDQQSYKIGDRELARIPIRELLELRDYYAAEARRERDSAAVASGLPRATMIHTRMSRA